MVCAGFAAQVIDEAVFLLGTEHRGLVLLARLAKPGQAFVTLW